MKAARKISATEAARSFSEVVSQVRYRGQEFIVEKGGEAVCRIGPVGATPAHSTLGDLLRLFEDLPPIDDGYRRLLKQIGRRQGRLPRSPWES
jgi:antitoxin (DNA-binding transcriptional repressor) of toxin-antitoxin stability system